MPVQERVLREPAHRHERPRGHRKPSGPRVPWGKVAVTVLTGVVVVVVLGFYGMGRMHDRAATNALQEPAASAPGPGGTVAGTGSKPADGSATAPDTSASASSSASASGRPAPSSSPSPSSSSSSSPKPSHSATPGASAPAGNQPAAAQVLTLINQARAQAGLPAYTLSSGLASSSRAHSLVMADGCGLAHQCPGEASVGDRITAAGVQWTSFGENIGDGGPVANTAAAIAQMALGLTDSMINEQPPDDGHRLNILSSSFRFIGIFVFRDAGGTVWMTQDFSG
jgi:uncharacterized protein YkwD